LETFAQLIPASNFEILKFLGVTSKILRSRSRCLHLAMIDHYPARPRGFTSRICQLIDYAQSPCKACAHNQLARDVRNRTLGIGEILGLGLFHDYFRDCEIEES